MKMNELIAQFPWTDHPIIRTYAESFSQEQWVDLTTAGVGHLLTNHTISDSTFVQLLNDVLKVSQSPQVIEMFRSGEHIFRELVEHQMQDKVEFDGSNSTGEPSPIDYLLSHGFDKTILNEFFDILPPEAAIVHVLEMARICQHGGTHAEKMQRFEQYWNIAVIQYPFERYCKPKASPREFLDYINSHLTYEQFQTISNEGVTAFLPPNPDLQSFEHLKRTFTALAIFFDYATIFVESLDPRDMKKTARKGDQNPTYHYLAPDQSEITLLTRNTDADGGDMAYCSLPVGQTSIAVCHKSIHEIWYFTAGEGQFWIKQGSQEEIYSVSPGAVVSLPKGTSFQFRNISTEEALEVVIVTMPPWPGEGEAMKVHGLWTTSLQSDERAVAVSDASASSTTKVASMGIFSGSARSDIFVPRLVHKPEAYHYLAPDLSEIRLLTRPTDAGGGDMAHCTLPAGQTSIAVKHKSIHELWYITSGSGEIWLQDGEVEEVHALQKGSYVSIPLEASFQFRTTSLESLEIIITSMPPWPGADEAVVVSGRWPTRMMASREDSTAADTPSFSP